MRFIDEIARVNHGKWVESGALGHSPGTETVMGIDPEDVRAFVEGKRATLPEPFTWESTNLLVLNAPGKDVLCLAGGGGQQSVLFSLLGARVTVLDISETQLERDQKAAAHYGYEVTTIQGDMRDLSELADESFDIVCQPISMPFVPDVRVVYREVARVLKPGGLYEVGHCNPATFPVCFDGPDNGWDGVGYRIAEPYIGGAIRMRADGSENMREGEPTGEHRHLLSDIFGGLIENGFVIAHVQEDPRHLNHVPGAVPGSPEHWIAHVAEYFWIIARKPEGESAMRIAA